MINILKTFRTLLILASLLLVPVVVSNTVNAQSASDAVCESLGVTGNDCDEGGNGVNRILRQVLNILSIVAGVIAVIMMIIAGIKFTTSQGDSGSVSSARQTVIYAIVGVVIVVVSQVLVRFVLTEAAQLTNESDTGTSTPATPDPVCRPGQPC